MPDIEQQLLQYCQDLRNEDEAVSTKMLILKAISLDPNFHSKSKTAITTWVYLFLRRNDLSIRRPTRVGRKLSLTLAVAQRDFFSAVCERFLPFGTLEGLNWADVVNMDETAVNFEPTINSTVAPKGSKTVSVRCASSNNPSITVCLAVTTTGVKLPPFVVFKGVPGARIYAQMQKVVPQEDDEEGSQRDIASQCQQV
ncbi:hypothetical protein DYB32_010928, partial [Aphanomyces invadans]